MKILYKLTNLYLKISKYLRYSYKESNRSALKENLAPLDPKRNIRRSVYFLVLGLAGFILWASLAPIDEGVVASGSVVLDGRRKIVQHYSGGIIKSIYVKEGDFVKQNQLIIQLDDTKENYELQSVKGQISTTQLQIKYFNNIQEEISPLVEEGFYTKNKFLETEKQISELKINLISLNNRYAVVFNELQRTKIVSPSSGKLMGLAFSTLGAIIPPGGKIADIIPTEDRLVIEALIEPHLIDKLHHGLDVEVRFSSLRKKITPIVLGKVDWISGDTFNSNEKNNSNGFYLTKVRISEEELSNKLPGEELKPGMPVEVIIKTGERTLTQYFLKPIIDKIAISLKEY
jgi:protease secretion system membrane fusion protein